MIENSAPSPFLDSSERGGKLTEQHRLLTANPLRLLLPTVTTQFHRYRPQFGSSQGPTIQFKWELLPRQQFLILARGNHITPKETIVPTGLRPLFALIL